jgi:hypothetical protein
VRPFAPLPALAAQALIAPALLAALAGSASARSAQAEPAPAAPPPPATLPEDAKVDFAADAPEGKVSNATPPTAAELDAGPPLRPRHNGLVLESTLGVLGFAGQFRHVAPTAYWLHGQLGYEVLPWLMLFGEGELAFTDTSEASDPSHVKAFPMWGFGAGARITFHATDRVAFFAQGSIDGLTAVVPHDALAVYGYRSAESLNASFGVRVGIEWYQIDRHLALAAQVGVRDAQGFSNFIANDFPLMWDAGAGVRYTF